MSSRIRDVTDTSGGGGQRDGWRGLLRRIPIPYVRRGIGATEKAATNVEKQSNNGTATIINGMKPHSIGRTLGIGLRVAGRIAGQRAEASGQNAATSSGTA